MFALMFALAVAGTEPAAAAEAATPAAVVKPAAEPASKPTRPTPAARRFKVQAADLVAYPSAPGLYVGHVSSDVAGGWLVFAAGFEPVASTTIADDQRSITFEGGRGRYAVLFFPPGQITQPQVVKLDLGGSSPDPDPDPDPDPENPYNAPPASVRAKLAPVMGISTERADATKLAALYGRAAELIETGLAARAAGVRPEIGTPGELRAYLVENGRPLGLSGKYSGLADAVDKALADLVGLDATRELVQTDADGFESLAWAIWEGGR